MRKSPKATVWSACLFGILFCYAPDRTRFAVSTRPRAESRAVLLPGCNCAGLCISLIWCPATEMQTSPLVAVRSWLISDSNLRVRFGRFPTLSPSECDLGNTRNDAAVASTKLNFAPTFGVGLDQVTTRSETGNACGKA